MMATARAGVSGPLVSMSFGQIGAVDQAHVDEQPAIDIAVVMDWHDMRRLQPGRSGCFATESGHELRISAQRERQPLQRYRPIPPDVIRPENLPHPTLTD
jgi:hypothetical protein